MARPKKSPAERRDRQLKVRMTDAEYAEVYYDAGRHGLSASEIVRRRYFGHRTPTATDQRDTARLGMEIHRCGVNLNQIAHHMNAGGSAPRWLFALIARINAFLDNLS